MGKFRDFFSHIGNGISFGQLKPQDRALTFYSEGRNYWSYLGGLLQETLESTDQTVCYVSSSKDDPGLQVEHPRLKKFLIGEGFVRDWFFANMDTKVVVMTMPDLHQYQVKKSKHSVHYIYVQHSLVSFQMVYRPGAFDHYDTIFCAGPHHLKEMRAIEACYGLKEKALFEHGYARLDSIYKEANLKKSSPRPSAQPTHYLLAPSWGEGGTIETGVGEKIVEALIAKGAKVTLRPHPQTIKFFEAKVNAIVDKHKAHPNFDYENNVQGQESLHASDVMICDWSGAALDYAFGLNKPVIFVDVERKVNNPNYTDIKIEPFEVTIRDSIGTIIQPNDLKAIQSISIPEIPDGLAEKYVFNVGHSDQVGAKEIIRILASLQNKA